MNETDFNEPDQELARRRLVRILQAAHAGELAASLAYGGHSSSVRDPLERAQILRILEQELEHRQCVATMLGDLGAQPDPRRERRLEWVGRTISALCHVGGWFMPMYGAGRLESGNIREYEQAARYAHLCGRSELIEPLLVMAEVEWDHEVYFREKVESHILAIVFPRWNMPPPRDDIRRSFCAFENKRVLRNDRFPRTEHA